MPQSSLTYAVTRVKVLEGRLIRAERLERLLEQPNAREALNLLHEYGYGSQGILSGDYESMVQNELAEAARFIQSVTPDEELTDLFLMRGDYQNLKALLKMNLSAQRVPQALTSACKIPPERLQEALSQHSYYILPPHLQEAIRKAEAAMSLHPDPRELDMLLDGAYLSWAVQKGADRDKFVGDYFAAMIDFYNASLALRAEARMENAESLRGSLIKGGKISQRIWTEWLAQKEGPIGLSTPYGTDFAVTLAEAMKNKAYWRFEAWRDAWLSGYMKQGGEEWFSIKPLIAYLTAKEAEARAVRTVMVGKTNDLGADIIRERLRGLYA